MHRSWSLLRVHRFYRAFTDATDRRDSRLGQPRTLTLCRTTAPSWCHQRCEFQASLRSLQAGYGSRTLSLVAPTFPQVLFCHCVSARQAAHDLGSSSGPQRTQDIGSIGTGRSARLLTRPLSLFASRYSVVKVSTTELTGCYLSGLYSIGCTHPYRPTCNPFESAFRSLDYDAGTNPDTSLQMSSLFGCQGADS